MTIIDILFLITGILLVSWASIAAYIVVQDRAERRAWQQAEELKRWRQTIDAYRRIAEND